MVSLKHSSPWTTETEKTTIEGNRSSYAPSTSPSQGLEQMSYRKSPSEPMVSPVEKRDLKVNIQFLSIAGHFLGRLAGSCLKWITGGSRRLKAWVSGRDGGGGWGLQQPALISWQRAFLLCRSTWAESSSQWMRPYAELSLFWPGSSVGSSA